MGDLKTFVVAVGNDLLASPVFGFESNFFKTLDATLKNWLSSGFSTSTSTVLSTPSLFSDSAMEKTLKLIRIMRGCGEGGGVAQMVKGTTFKWKRAHGRDKLWIASRCFFAQNFVLPLLAMLVYLWNHAYLLIEAEV